MIRPFTVFWTLVVSMVSATDAPLAAQQSCTLCASADSLVKRFRLPESPIPSREAAGWRVPRKIVVVGGSDWVSALRTVAPGVEVIGVQSPAAALPLLADADVYIGHCGPDILKAGKQLRWLQMVSAGADRCASLPEVAGRQVVLTNAQAIYGPQLADHAMGLLLALTRRLNFYQEQQRRGVWNDVDAASGVWELEGKTMLIVGLGGIGTEIARRANAFGMHVIATRNSSRERPSFVDYVGLSSEAATLAARSDVVVNVVPLTRETRGMFDAAFFRQMKPTALFVNVSRGETVVTNDLVDALRTRRIAGAALDVVDPEPLPTKHPLWKMPSVVITPHTGGASDQGNARMLLVAVENVRRYVRGDRLLSVVDIRRGY